MHDPGSVIRGLTTAAAAVLVTASPALAQTTDSGWAYGEDMTAGQLALYHPDGAPPIVMITCFRDSPNLLLTMKLPHNSYREGDLVRAQVLLGSKPYQLDSVGSRSVDGMVEGRFNVPADGDFMNNAIAARQIQFGIPGQSTMAIEFPPTAQLFAKFNGKCAWMRGQNGVAQAPAAPAPQTPGPSPSPTPSPAPSPAPSPQVALQPSPAPQPAPQPLPAPQPQVAHMPSPQPMPAPGPSPAPSPQAAPQPAPVPQPTGQLPVFNQQPLRYSDTVAYRCENNAQFSVRYEGGDNFDRAVLLIAGIDEIDLPSVVAGSGTKYNNGQIDWHTKGPDGILTQNGRELVCEEMR